MSVRANVRKLGRTQCTFSKSIRPLAIVCALILIGCGPYEADNSDRPRHGGGSRTAFDAFAPQDSEQNQSATVDEVGADSGVAIEWLKLDSELTDFPSDPSGKDGRSERLRREVGAPVGWRTRMVAERALPRARRQVVLLFSTGDAKDSYRLALAESRDEGSLHIVVEQECGDGFVTYCERTFKQVPTAVQLEQFLRDFSGQ